MCSNGGHIAPRTPDLAPARDVVRITHPFHPRRGEVLDVLRREGRFGEDFVIHCVSPGHTAWLPAAWTSLVPPPPPVRPDGEQARFRVGDLLELAALVAELER